jgi:hypothetical protein
VGTKHIEVNGMRRGVLCNLAVDAPDQHLALHRNAELAGQSAITTCWYDLRRPAIDDVHDVQIFCQALPPGIDWITCTKTLIHINRLS